MASKLTFDIGFDGWFTILFHLVKEDVGRTDLENSTFHAYSLKVNELLLPCARNRPVLSRLGYFNQGSAERTNKR